MSVTYFVVAKPGQIKKAPNLQYAAYVGTLAGFKAETGDTLKEFQITTLSEHASKHVSVMVATLNSANFHSDKVYFIVDLGYEKLDDLVDDINADLCSMKWRWVASWLAEWTLEVGVHDYQVAGFRDTAVQALIFDHGAAKVRKNFITDLAAV
jgi:hypothetical protein